MDKIKFAAMPTEHENRLYLTTIGEAEMMPGQVCGPRVRSYCLLHYITKGKCKFQVNGMTYHLQAGQGFFIAPDFETRYETDGDEPWNYIWVGAAGEEMKHLMHVLGLSQANPIFSCHQGDRLVHCVRDMLQHRQMTMTDHYFRMSTLYRFIAILSEERQVNQPLASVNSYIANVMTYVRHHLHEHMSTAEIAATMNLNRSYLSSLFRSQTGMTLRSYIQLCRMTRAKYLLESTHLSIASIAESCGYEKSDSLNRTFRKTYGISPADYRKSFLADQAKSSRKLHES
ncbi:helix-turn-helix domain-containing protein [Mitsuokella multacida]|uniref:AraC family transcriptional regulator n=1 Tax=Mitsuokella multacida TaxID=52226 RepID=UPI003FA3127D